MENPIIQKHLNISDKCLTDIFTIQQFKKERETNSLYLLEEFIYMAHGTGCS